AGRAAPLPRAPATCLGHVPVVLDPALAARSPGPGLVLPARPRLPRLVPARLPGRDLALRPRPRGRAHDRRPSPPVGGGGAGEPPGRDRGGAAAGPASPLRRPAAAALRGA